MSGNCKPFFDWFRDLAIGLNIGLCVVAIVSYIPQYYRIIHAKSSEGFSPIFLLLGTTSTAAAMFNTITFQSWEPLLCCLDVRFLTCLELNMEVFQTGFQWCCFTLLFVLYMIYYPQHLKYIDVDAEEHEADEHVADEHAADEHEAAAPLLPQPSPELRLRSPEWRLSLVAAWVIGVNFFVMAVTTLYLVPPPPHDREEVTAWWTVLGVTASVFAAIQYVPQLVHTYRSKLVGTLSIPMMAIQTPGGLFVLANIMWRPRMSSDWDSEMWIGFLVAMFLEGCLLIMCITWRVRQRKLGIDDFGNPLLPVFLRSEPYLAERGEDDGGPASDGHFA